MIVIMQEPSIQLYAFLKKCISIKEGNRKVMCQPLKHKHIQPLFLYLPLCLSLFIVNAPMGQE